MKFSEELKQAHQERYGVASLFPDNGIKELKKYLRSKLVTDNSPFAIIYVCNGGAVSYGFPNISTDEKFTIHSTYADSLRDWLKENGFDIQLVELKPGDNEYPPAFAGWISQSQIKKWRVRIAD